MLPGVPSLHQKSRPSSSLPVWEGQRPLSPVLRAFTSSLLRPSSFFPQRMLFARMSPPGLSIMAVQGLPTWYVRVSRGRAPRDRKKEAACYIKPGHRHEEGITDTMPQWSEQSQSCPNSRKGDITHISLRHVYEGFVAIFIPLWVTSYRALQVMLRLSNKGFHLKNNEAPLKTFKK